MLTLGQKLKKIREEKGVSLQIASSSLGIAKSTLYGYEHDSREPGIEIINKMADYYRVNPLDIIRPDLVPKYHSIDLKELFKKEDIDVEGKRLSNGEKEMIYRIIKAIINV